MGTVWEDVRGDFPALETHVYLNAAAASPTPRPVRQAMAAFYRQLEEDGDLHWNDWLARTEEVRTAVARLVNAEADEIAFVPNTSTGMNLIVDVLGGLGPVLSDELEFPTVTLPWIHRGIAINMVPAIEGVLRLDSFSPAFAPRAATIAVSHVQFSNGCRIDLEGLGALKGERRFVVCGSQSVGAFPVDVKKGRIDALATAGHKWLCAGYGAGFVYIARDVLEQHPPRTIGWLSVEDPFTFDNMRYRVLASNRRVETGCPAFAGIFALGAAVDYLLEIGIERIAERVLGLNEYLTAKLEEAKIPVLSPGGENRSGQTLCAVNEPPAAVAFLKERGIQVTPKPEGIRIATHFYNNEADVDACVAALRDYQRLAGRPLQA